MRTLIRLLFAVTLIVATTRPAAAQEIPAPPRPGCPRLVAAAAEAGPLGPGQQEAIAEALQDEYRGEATYARVLETLGEVRPFSNVVHAERRHASFLEDLLKSRDLPVPANQWTDAEVPTYSSRQEACAAAVEFEVENVALYDRLLASGNLPEDVETAFQHNRRASLDHHRPAFARCADTGNEPAAQTAPASRGRPGRGGPAARGRGGHGCGRGARAPGRGGHRFGCGGRHAGRGASGTRGRCHRGGGPTAPAPAESGS
jgi:hypothetical protein